MAITYKTFVDTEGVTYLAVPVVFHSFLGFISQNEADKTYNVWWKRLDDTYKLVHTGVTQENFGYFRSTLGG